MKILQIQDCTADFTLRCFRHTTLSFGNLILALFCIRLIIITTQLNKLKNKLSATKLYLLSSILTLNITTFLHFGV